MLGEPLAVPRDRVVVADVLDPDGFVLPKFDALGVTVRKDDFDRLVAGFEAAFKPAFDKALAEEKVRADAMAERHLASTGKITGRLGTERERDPRELIVERGCRNLAELRVARAASVALNRLALGAIVLTDADAPRVMSDAMMSGKAIVSQAAMDVEFKANAMARRILAGIDREVAKTSGETTSGSKTAGDKGS